MNAAELIGKVNAYIRTEKPKQVSIGQCWLDDFMEVLPEAREAKTKVVAKGEIDEHRWYGCQSLVFKVTLGDSEVFVKTFLVTQSYSEQQSISDIEWEYPQFTIVRPKQVETTVYEATPADELNTLA